MNTLFTSTRNQLAGLLVAACLLMPLPAVGAVLYDGGFELLSNQNPNLEDQFWMEIRNDNDPRIDFRFYNYGPVDSFISRIYFQEPFGNFLDFNEFSAADHIDHSGNGSWSTSLESNLPPPVVPDANWFAIEFIAGGLNPQPGNGVHPGQEITLSFALSGNAGDMLDALVDGSLLIALRVMGQGDVNTSATYLNTPGVIVPVPPAVGLGLLGFAFVGMTHLRRRFASSK